MEFPKMLYKGVKPNAFDQLEAEQTTVVQGADEEAQAREAGWHGFDETPQAPEAKSQTAETGQTVPVTAADKPAAQPKQAKPPKSAAADKPAEA